MHLIRSARGGHCCFVLRSHSDRKARWIEETGWVAKAEEKQMNCYRPPWKCRWECRLDFPCHSVVSPNAVWQVIHAAFPDELFSSNFVHCDNQKEPRHSAPHPTWMLGVVVYESFVLLLPLLVLQCLCNCCMEDKMQFAMSLHMISGLQQLKARVKWIQRDETGLGMLLDDGRWPDLRGAIHCTMALYAVPQYQTKP